MQDVVVFFRQNFRVVLEAGAGPEMGSMVGGLGTDTIMNYVTIGYRRYQDNKAKRLQQRTQ